MGFRLTDEQRELARTVRALLRDRPPGRTWRELARTGCLGLTVDDELGGAGAGLLELGLVAEEVGRALPAEPFMTSAVASTLLLSAAATDPARQILAGLVSGEVVATTAFESLPPPVRPEPRGAGPLRVRVDAAAPGSVHVSGCLSWVVHAGRADVLLLRGIAAHPMLLAVDLPDPGVTLREESVLDLSEPAWSVEMVDAHARVVSGPGSCDGVVARAWDRVLPVLAMEQVGAGQQILDLAVAYAKQREQFGRAIGSFQSVKHMLADRHVELDAARLLGLYACWAADAGAPDQRPAARSAAAAAAAASYAAAADSLQTFGGIGYTWEHVAHRYLRRARARQAFLGSHDDHLDAVADYVLESPGVRIPSHGGASTVRSH